MDSRSPGNGRVSRGHATSPERIDKVVLLCLLESFQSFRQTVDAERDAPRRLPEVLSGLEANTKCRLGS